jgi:tetraacyldisaccharide-1-P 4'-kinase
MDNNPLLNVQFEELSQEDKAIIEKATEEFQDKRLLSYGNMRDKVIQQFSLPRVLLSGQRDEDEDADKKFAMDAMHKIVREALTNHNTTFFNTFTNVMTEVMCGVPIQQTGPAYFNNTPSTTGTVAGTSK